MFSPVLFGFSSGVSRLSASFLIRLVTSIGVLAVLAFGLAPSPATAQSPTAVTSIVNGAQDTTLQVNYDGGLLAPGKFGDISNYSAPGDSIPATGGGTRLMWYPAKAAFRSGRVNGSSWDPSNVGNYSGAFGLDTAFL